MCFQRTTPGHTRVLPVMVRQKQIRKSAAAPDDGAEARESLRYHSSPAPAPPSS
ncbi:hypothetical protein DPMN_132651 [Dreissena polymorpha]|uniref:Uncharacterized protein n=1 Tax=Dreissena polymorpha TaxID=45954 RepID=A0A9D4JE16_DREPO|nr:hypothetical protein DPMN_132651 [Dreissena polymorpha]